MQAIIRAKTLIENRPDDPETKILISLLLALQAQKPFDVQRLYELRPTVFDMAIEIIKEWRLDRHYLNQHQLLDFLHSFVRKPHE